MTRLDAIRERYLRGDFNVRLGGLAANLARLASFSNLTKRRESVGYLLEESKWFIEWTGPDVSLGVQAELVDLQIRLAVWHRAWQQGQMDEVRLQDMASQARTWSNRLLELSGLLKTDDP